VLLYSCTSVKVKISLSTIYFLHQTLQRTACNRTSSCNLLHDTMTQMPTLMTMMHHCI